MKEKPILFSTEMVKAILEGRKTQTRRILKNQSDANPVTYGHEWEIGELIARSPFGIPGDILWVREKWRPVGWYFEDGQCNIEYADGAEHRNIWLFDDSDKENDFYIMLCDIMEKKCEPEINEEDEEYGWTAEQIKEHMPWRPSIHMPKAAARIWLLIEEVRVERLQDVSEEDALAEGISYTFRGIKNHIEYPADLSNINKAIFSDLWSSINGRESWDSNPWVWVISFKVLSITGKPEISKLQEVQP